MFLTVLRYKEHWGGSGVELFEVNRESFRLCWKVEINRENFRWYWKVAHLVSYLSPYFLLFSLFSFVSLLLLHLLPFSSFTSLCLLLISFWLWIWDGFSYEPIGFHICSLCASNSLSTGIINGCSHHSCFFTFETEIFLVQSRDCVYLWVVPNPITLKQIFHLFFIKIYSNYNVFWLCFCHFQFLPYLLHFPTHQDIYKVLMYIYLEPVKSLKNKPVSWMYRDSICVPGHTQRFRNQEGKWLKSERGWFVPTPKSVISVHLSEQSYKPVLSGRLNALLLGPGIKICH